MTEDKIERRLSAILVADVVGYSKMMGQNETATLRLLQELRFSVINPLMGQHQGRIVKLMGDGILAEFRSIVDAVECAISIQKGIVTYSAAHPKDQKLKFRIGVNLGDVLIEGDDIYGDGVNIAARLQEIAEPDGVAIPSSVFGHIEGVIDDLFSDIGAQEFKNIAKPLRVYHYSPDPSLGLNKKVLRPFIDMPMTEKLTVKGGCFCGSIRYELSDKALGTMLCQCRMCQRYSGAPALAGTTFPTKALTFTNEQPKYFHTSHIAKRGFCENCGTAILYQGLIGYWTEWVVITTNSMDNPEDFPPTYHLGIESAMPWMLIHDDLPRTCCRDSPSLVDAYHSVGEEVP
jgi:adenylate cyclase